MYRCPSPANIVRKQCHASSCSFSAQPPKDPNLADHRRISISGYQTYFSACQSMCVCLLTAFHTRDEPAQHWRGDSRPWRAPLHMPSVSLFHALLFSVMHFSSTSFSLRHMRSARLGRQSIMFMFPLLCCP